MLCKQSIVADLHHTSHSRGTLKKAPLLDTAALISTQDETQTRQSKHSLDRE